MKEKVIIIGAGLAGISAGLHLNSESEVFEREEVPGGLCRTERVGDFKFDYGGHLLHFQEPQWKEFVFDLLGSDLVEHRRRAWVYSHHTLVPYPFQVNLAGLPKKVVWECLEGYLKAKIAGFINRVSGDKKDNFEKWVYRNFGQGIARNFLIPFNEKFWKVPLKDLGLEWARWSIPRPLVKEVILGSLGKQREGLGYNPIFYYPRSGGIEALIRKMVGKIDHLYLGKEAVEIDVEKREVVFSDGDKRSYARMISTIPIVKLLELVRPDQKLFHEAKDRLDYISVLIINVGIKGNVPPYHWIYFPEPEYPFYRTGFPSNLSPSMAPQGYSSIAAEITYDHKKEPDETLLEKDVITALIKCRLIQSRDQIVLTHNQKVKYAYVIFNRYRQENLFRIKSALEKGGIFTIGRYGGWDYLTMEGVLRQGKETIKQIEAG